MYQLQNCYAAWTLSNKKQAAMLAYIYQLQNYHAGRTLSNGKELKGGTAPLGLIFEDFVHFLKK